MRVARALSLPQTRQPAADEPGAATHGQSLPDIAGAYDGAGGFNWSSQHRDIAEATGHDALVPLLEPESSNLADADVLAMLDRRLVDLVEQRIRPGLTVRLRPFPAVTFTELDPGTRVWFPVPGMYGGFSVALMRNYLEVQSWSRTVDGSGQAHVITAEGTVLVDEGFISHHHLHPAPLRAPADGAAPWQLPTNLARSP